MWRFFSLFFFPIAQVFAAFNLTWKTPAINLDANPPIGDTDSNATLMIDSEGNAIASWSRTVGNGASEDIWAASYYHPQRVWTGALKVSGGGAAENSQAAIDQEGNAALVWEEGFPSQIKFRTLSKNGVWTPDLSRAPETISSSNKTQTFPQIVADQENTFHVIWIERMGGEERLCSASKPAHLPWIQYGPISSSAKKIRLVPKKSFVIEPKLKKILAVWEAAYRDALQIEAAIFSASTWKEPFTISKGNDVGFPTAGMDRKGNGVIAWEEKKGIYSKRLENEAFSQRVLKVSTPNYNTARPSVDVDGDGNAIIVYERYDSIHKFISGAELKAGARNWTPPIDISAPSPVGSAIAGYPVLSVNEIGDAVVIWKEFTGTNIVIQGAGYSLNTWSNTKTLSSLKENAGAIIPAYDIAVAINNSGNILAIWPEDSFGQGTLQIKSTSGVGLANTGPRPPFWDPEIPLLEGVATGRQIFHRYPAHGDLINIITWEAPEGISRFNVYRNNLSSLIGTVTEKYFEDHQRIPNQDVKYLITSLDENGQESSPITVVVSSR